MTISTEHMDELRSVSKNPQELEEGGVKYIHLPRIKLPDGRVLDALLRCRGNDGYVTRLFLAEPVPNKGVNWTVHQIFGKAWHTWSWNEVPADLRPIEIYLSHLIVLR
jgi:hypothetical protein